MTLSEAMEKRGAAPAHTVLHARGYERGKVTVCGTVHKAGNVTVATWKKS